MKRKSARARSHRAGKPGDATARKTQIRGKKHPAARELRVKMDVDLSLSHPEAAAGVKLTRAADNLARGELPPDYDWSFIAAGLNALGEAFLELEKRKDAKQRLGVSQPTKAIAELADRIERIEGGFLKDAVHAALKVTARAPETMAAKNRVERLIHEIRAARKRQSQSLRKRR